MVVGYIGQRRRPIPRHEGSRSHVCRVVQLHFQGWIVVIGVVAAVAVAIVVRAVGGMPMTRTAFDSRNGQTIVLNPNHKHMMDHTNDNACLTGTSRTEHRVPRDACLFCGNFARHWEIRETVVL